MTDEIKRRGEALRGKEKKKKLYEIEEGEKEKRGQRKTVWSRDQVF